MPKNNFSARDGPFSAFRSVETTFPLSENNISVILKKIKRPSALFQSLQKLAGTNYFLYLRRRK